MARFRLLLVTAVLATLTACNDGPDPARSVPVNLCEVVGPTLLTKLAPSATPVSTVDEVSTRRKRAKCHAAVSADDAGGALQQVSFTVEMTRFGGTETSPNRQAKNALDAHRGDIDGGDLTDIDTIEAVNLDYDGFLWSSDGTLRLVAVQKDTVFVMDYRPIDGVSMDDARLWLAGAADQILSRFVNSY